MTEKLIEAFEQDTNIVELKQTKQAIKQDEDLMQLIKDFEQQKKLYEETGYLSKTLQDLKIKLYQQQLIKTYKAQEKKFNETIEQLNKELNNLIHDDKICIKNPTKSRI